MNFDVNSLLASLLVSSVGFVLFMYGKRMRRWPQLGVGMVLLLFPYFVSGVGWMFAIAVVLLFLLWVALRLGY